MKRPALLGKEGTGFGCLNVGCAGLLLLLLAAWLLSR